VPQEEDTTNRPFSCSFSNLLIEAATAVVSLLLVIGTQQEAWAQPDPGASSQIYCGPWAVESRAPTREIPSWQYWNYRWCYSPEVLGGWYKDYAGYSETAPEVTLTYTPSADSVTVGEPVTFRLTETNNESYAISGLHVVIYSTPSEHTLPTDFVSATLSQGQCRFPTNQGPKFFPDLYCDLGTLGAGDTAVIDVVVVPQEPGTIRTRARDSIDPISDGGCCGQGPPLTRPGVSASVSVYPG
jgi:Domain of unknown function DUF11